MLRAETTSSSEVCLTPQQFARALQGGFKDIETALGSSVAVFNVVSRSIFGNGTKQQYDAALAILDGKPTGQGPGSPESQTDCPICFCEAEDSVQASCGHTYFLECFSECCKSAASMCKDEFQIKCQGDVGECTTIFSLRELKGHLPSLIVETVLSSSFEEHIKRHPESFRYCPTPDCVFIYPGSSVPNPPSYTCPRCFESICISCDERHGGYSCAE
jgi:hypothetical protein